MELILYYLNESKDLLITFLIVMFIIGVVGYLFLRKFRQDKKMKVFFYGLLLRMNNMDIFKLSLIIIKVFLVFYTIIIMNETLMWLCLGMIIMLTITYIIFAHKRILYEIIFTTMQVIMIYYTYIINNYMLEVEDTSLALMIKSYLVVFVVIVTTYLFFNDLDTIAQNRVNKDFEQKKGDLEEIEEIEERDE